MEAPVTGGLKEALSKAMEGDPVDGKPVDNKVRQDWNLFLQDLEAKGLRGKSDLDKGGKGYQLFDEYVKANPSTSLNREMLPVIRKELLNYRNYVLESVKNGSNKLSEGVREDNFMRHVVENEKTGDPNYPGSNLTITKFPDSYLSTFNNGKKVSTENKGFATVKNK